LAINTSKVAIYGLGYEADQVRQKGVKLILAKGDQRMLANNLKKKILGGGGGGG
jgi:hypothetical protein